MRHETMKTSLCSKATHVYNMQQTMQVLDFIFVLITFRDNVVSPLRECLRMFSNISNEKMFECSVSLYFTMTFHDFGVLESW